MNQQEIDELLIELFPNPKKHQTNRQIILEATFMTIMQTAKKQIVNSYHYILDRVSKKFELPSLASLITQKS